MSTWRDGGLRAHRRPGAAAGVHRAPCSPRSAHRRSCARTWTTSARPLRCGTTSARFSELGTGPTVDLCVFMEELGSVAAPGPFFASAVLAAPVLDAVGSDLLPAVLERRRRPRRSRSPAPTATGRRTTSRSRASCPTRRRSTSCSRSRPPAAVVATRRPGVRRLETIDPSRPLFDVRHGRQRPTLGTIDPDALEQRRVTGDGRARGRDGRHRAAPLRDGARVREGPAPVRRAHRLVPGDPAQARRHEPRRRARVERGVLRGDDRRRG